MLGIEARRIRVGKLVVGDHLTQYGEVLEVGKTTDPWLPPTHVRITFAGIKGFRSAGFFDLDPNEVVEASLDNNDRR